MKRKRKAISRTLSLLLVLSMVVMLVPIVPMKAEAAENGITKRIAELRNEYPAGKYWHMGNDGANKVRDYGCGNKTCSQFDGGWQCWAFASMIFREIFGKAPNLGGGGTKGYNTDDVRVGDYVRFSVPNNTTYGHSFLVIARNGDNVTVVESNYPSQCQINWDRTLNLKSEQDTWAVDGNGNTYKTKCKFSFYIHAYNYDEIANSYVPDVGRDHNPVFWNNDQSAGEDFYAYIYAYRGSRYVESGKNIEGGDWPFTYVMQSTQPASVGASLNPNRIWHFTRSPGADYYFIQNEYSGWTLEMAGGQPVREAKLITYYDFHQNGQQQWVILAGGEGNNYRLMPKRNRTQQRQDKSDRSSILPAAD